MFNHSFNLLNVTIFNHKCGLKTNQLNKANKYASQNTKDNRAYHICVAEVFPPCLTLFQWRHYWQTRLHEHILFILYYLLFPYTADDLIMSFWLGAEPSLTTSSTYCSATVLCTCTSKSYFIEQIDLQFHCDPVCFPSEWYFSCLGFKYKAWYSTLRPLSTKRKTWQPLQTVLVLELHFFLF